MNTHTAIALAAAALMAGATASAPCLAATHSTMAKSSKMSLAALALILTKAQRKTAWKDLHSAAITAASVIMALHRAACLPENRAAAKRYPSLCASQ